MRFAVLILLLTMLRSPAIAADADLRLRPNDGAPGETITVRLRNVPPNLTGAIAWEGVAEPIATFTTDADGDVEVPVTVPDLPPGLYEVAAVAGDVTVSDTFTIEGDTDPAAVITPIPTWMTAAPPLPGDMIDRCATPGTRDVAVATSAELADAVASAEPGDRIVLADGTYPGNLVLERDGIAGSPIALCGSRAAVLTGEGWQESGYALHLTGDHWFLGGFTVTNAQKGIMLDDADHATIAGVEVHTIGHEAIHLRDGTTDSLVFGSDIHDTGLDNGKFGEGVYIGTAVSNWPKISDGEPDRSDRNRVIGNRIWGTSSESIDLKEGTEGGEVRDNQFDGSAMTDADSWVDAKGNGYLIAGNTGVGSPADGFQTHVIDDMEWGTGNDFAANTITIDNGVGVYIHQPETAGNIVRCDNVMTTAAPLTNLPDGCTG